MLILESPTKLRFVGYDDKVTVLEGHLKYNDKKVDFEIQKFKQAHWFINKYGEEAYKEKMIELKAQRTKSLLFKDEGGLWTYSGMANHLAVAFDDKIENRVNYPEPKLIPWNTLPEFELRPYQTESVDKLLHARHGGVELATGSGKTACVIQILKELGLKSLVMAPSVSIAEQIFAEATARFGKKYVGAYFAGKKDFTKRFVIGVAQSLTKIERDTPVWNELAKCEVYIGDEAHMVPCQTFAKVCFGIVAAAPYRFFFSATQMRNDGLDLLLDAITGDILHHLSVREAVDQGYLAKPIFKMVKTYSDVSYTSGDANKMTRAHLYYNDRVAKTAGEMANKFVRILNRPTLILIEEIEQFSKLLPYLRHEAVFAHGGLTKENSVTVPERYHNSDPNKLVKEFNAGKHQILVGTSCVSTGTDFKAVKACIYLQGGKSEIQVKQAVGRCTRLVPGKTDCFFVDFDVENVDVTHRHSNARRGLYAEVYAAPDEVGNVD